MSISIITRAYKTSELKNLINNLNSNNEIEKEIIAVCNIKDYNIENAKLIIEDSNRFQARITGIKNANYDKILLLDSDQIPEKGLLEELDNKNEDMIIIPEKSMNNNFTSKCLDDFRYRVENYAKRYHSPFIPVIPRMYRTSYAKDSINELPTKIYGILSHEDSILYYEIFKKTQNIGFAGKYIYNYDPNFFTLMKKAFLYGKYKKDVKSIDTPDDIKMLIYKLNQNALNIREIGFGKGYIIQILRGIAYELGEILS